MSGINLLPWRAERRKQKQKEFFSVTALALLFTAALLMLIHFRVSGMIDFQKERNRYLESEVALLDQKIKEIEDLEIQKKRLIAKMEVIQQLQVSRPEMVHLFDELARTLPEGVQIIDFGQTDRLLTVNGVAQSNARVSAYMRNLDASPWFQDPVLSVIEAKQDAKDRKDGRGSRFTLQVKQATEVKDVRGKTPS